MLNSVAARIPLFYRVVSLYAVLFGIIFSFNQLSGNNSDIPLELPTAETQTIQIDYENIVSKTIIDGEPKLFKVERLGIELTVESGRYDSSTNEWSLSDDAIFYATMTDLPNNQNGITFLYGHNNMTALEPLAWIVIGDKAVIETKNGHTFTYRYTSDEYVSPDQVDILSEDSNEPVLVVMTCEGIFSQSRRLMYFDLTEAK